MKVLSTNIPEVLILEPRVFSDERGFFVERYNKRQFKADTGVDMEFVQDNHSRSARNVLRGLHYQVKQTQGKLIWVVEGEIYDVAVDLRRSSPTFGQSAGFPLSARAQHMAWVPPGFAHGFLVMSDVAQVLYKTSNFYAPEHERTLLWSDPSLGIAWPLEAGASPLMAEKDRKGLTLASAECFV